MQFPIGATLSRPSQKEVASAFHKGFPRAWRNTRGEGACAREPCGVQEEKGALRS